MESLWQDIRYGARLLTRFPAVTAAAVLTLSLGTGVNTAFFSIVNAVLLRPLEFPAAHELVHVWRTELPRLQYGSVSYPRFVDWRTRNRAFVELGVFAPAGLTLAGREGPERMAGARASASLFRTLAAPPVMGRYFGDDEDRPGGTDVVVLGEQFWRQRLGGDLTLLGQTLTINGRPHTIVGIAPPVFRDMWRVDAWVPLAMANNPAERRNSFLLAVGRVKPGLTDAALQASLAELAVEMKRDVPGDDYGFFTMPLQDVLVQGPRQALWVLLAATAVVLLIACANVANLLLARAVTRQREIAVRTALGAGRLRLVRQLITEAVLLAIGGGALGLTLAAALLQLFAAVAPANFPRLGTVGLDARVLAFSLIVASAAGLLAGLLPAWQIARADPADALRDGGSRGATAGRARAASRVLVIGEIALAVVLVAAAGLTVRSLQALTRQDLGLDTRNVLTFSVGLPNVQLPADAERVTSFMQTFEERLRAIPGVTEVGAISMLPIANTGTNGPVRIADRVIRPEDSPLAEFRAITPGYFDSLRIPVLVGRGPDTRDRAGTARVVAINETLARQLWPGVPLSDVIGRQLGVGWDPDGAMREIVGIVRDVRARRPDAPPDAETYVPFAQIPFPTMAFTVRTAMPPESLVMPARQALAQLNPDIPLAAVRTMEEVVAASTRNSRTYSSLAALFGVLAAVLAVVGIYGVMSYSVAQRGRELAIRSAIGASRGALRLMIVREGVSMSAIGIAAGLVGAIGASRLLGSLLYQVSPSDPLVLALTAAGVATCAVLGYVVPAWRASRVAPADALRAD